MKLRWLLIRQADRAVPAVDQGRAAGVVPGRVAGQGQEAIPVVVRDQRQVGDREREVAPTAVQGRVVDRDQAADRVQGRAAIPAVDQVQGQAAGQGRVVGRDQAAAPAVGRAAGQARPPLISHRRLTPLARKR